MGLRIYNTLTGRKEDFQPLAPPEVRMYVCGVTVYDECHLGHARAYVSFDIIARYLAFCGYRVRYVRNVTDVDDKIIARAGKENRDPQEIAKRYYGEFARQMQLLGLSSPAVEPRATEHIPAMQELIGRLISRDYAYVQGGDVFFEVSKTGDYGKLSKRSLADMEAGARVEINENKKNPMDFALWKAAKPGEPFWDSPWGKGRPGWHIECSAMSMQYLGESFDIHGGGQDLIFPHHENEIAQSEAATGKPLARFWIHNGFVMFQKHKMSKSLGNVFTLSKLFEKFPAPVVKFFLLTKHYRSPLDFDPVELQEAHKSLQRIDNTIGLVRQRLEQAGMTLSQPALERSAWEASQIVAQFCDTMDDDFNTPRALALIHECMGNIHHLLRETKDVNALAARAGEFILLLEVLGVPYQAFVLKAVEDQGALSETDEQRLLSKTDLSEEEIVLLIAARNAARHSKNFARSDRIRRTLADKGVVLRDSKEGATTWVRIDANAGH